MYLNFYKYMFFVFYCSKFHWAKLQWVKLSKHLSNIKFYQRSQKCCKLFNRNELQKQQSCKFVFLRLR